MGFEPTASSMPSRRAPNCATAPPMENWCFPFIAPQIGSVKRRRSVLAEESVAGLEPAVACGENQRHVVAGVVGAQAGAREVSQRAFEEERAAPFEDMRADDELRSEVHPGGVAWGNIVRAEDDAARRRD